MPNRRISKMVRMLASAVLALSLTPTHAADPLGLPHKSEWLPGKVKRGTDGKLYLDADNNTQTVKESSEFHPTPPLTPKSTPITDNPCPSENAKRLYKDWVTLSWEAPTTYINGEQLGNNLLGYRIYYWQDAAPKREEIEVIKKVTEYRINGLTLGKTYCFAIRAVDKMGIESPLSETIAVKLEPPR